MSNRPSLRRGPDAISPKAHYTGHVWVRSGLSHPELGTWQGRVLFWLVRDRRERVVLLGEAAGPDFGQPTRVLETWAVPPGPVRPTLAAQAPAGVAAGAAPAGSSIDRQRSRRLSATSGMVVYSISSMPRRAGSKGPMRRT
jgi:hypothetical protein